MCKIIPCNVEGGNAIKGVAFAVELRQELSHEQIEKIREIYSISELSVKLPRQNTIEQIMVQVNGPLASNQNVKISGIVFDRISPKGEIDWALVFNNKSVVVQCNAYTRWNNVFMEVKNLLVLILSAIESSIIDKIGIEYLDVFYIENPEEQWTKKLFKMNGDYFCNNVFNVKENLLWHSHHGYFSHNTKQEVVLNRLNVDFLNKDNNFLIEIRTHHSIEKQKEIFVKNYFEHEEIEKDLEYLHDENKKIFKSLLTDEVLKTINLNS